jgi:hypothetical protein
VIGALEHGVDLVDVGLLTGILVASFVIWRRLRFFERVRAYEAASADGARAHPAAARRKPGDAPSAPPPPRPTHRAA